MPKKHLVIILAAILVLVISIQIIRVEANPVPFTQTPNLERPVLTIMTPQNDSTYNTSNIPLNFTVKQPDSWGVPTWWNYIGRVNFVNVTLDGNLSAHYSQLLKERYLNGNMTTHSFSDTGQFSVDSIYDWINQTTPGMHTLNVTVTSHTYSLSPYPGSNVKDGAMYDGQPIYEYPIIVSNTCHFTVDSNEVVNPTPSPTVPSPTLHSGLVPQNPPVIITIAVLVIVALLVVIVFVIRHRKTS